MLKRRLAGQARLSLHLSKYHIVGNHMSRLICLFSDCKQMEHGSYWSYDVFP